MTAGKKILISLLILLPVLLVVIFSFLETEQLLDKTPLFINGFYFLVILLTAVFAWVIVSNISKRKKTEQSLRRYTDIVEYTQVLIRDMDDKIIYWNNGMTSLYGWNKQEAIGHTCHQLFSTVFPIPLSKIKEQLLENGYWQGELQHSRKNRDSIYVSSRWSLIRDEKGVPTAIVETNNDITDLKHARNTINALSHELSFSRDGIYTVDTNQKVKSWNKGAENFYGFTAEEMIGRQINEMLRTTAPTSEIDLIINKLNNGGYWNGELKRKTKNGDDVYVQTSASPIIESDGTITGYLGVSFDITEQVKLREQVHYLARLVDQCTDAIISVDTTGKIVSWNEGAVAMYGHETHEAIGKNVSMLIPRELADEEKVVIRKVINGEPVHQFETKRIRKDGSRILISLTLSPLKDNDGNITGVVGMTRDISEHREAQQKIVQSEENLQAIFDNASEGFILTDANFTIKSLNRNAEEIPMFNVVSAIRAEQNLLDFVPAERKEVVRGFFESALAGNTVQFDRSYVAPDGSISWFNLTYNPVLKDDIIKGLCITSRDVTEKKIAEQQKEFDRSNMNALINNTNDLMWSVDRNFNLITSNAAFDEMLKRMSGKPVEKGSNILSWQFTDEMRQRYKGYYERAFAGEGFTEVEYTLTSFEYWAENSFFPIYEGNKVIGTACYSRDISKQKKSEEQLQNSFNEKWALAERMSAILNTLPANIALLNDKGIIVDVNNSWKDFAYGNGFQGSQYSIGQNYLQIAEKSDPYGNADGKTVANGIKRIIEDNAGEFVFEYACHAPHTQRWFRMVATPLKDKDYSGAVVMHVDISELKMLEQERLNSKIIEQKKITRAMLQAQEKERNELGRELHDNVCQILAAIKMKLSFCTDNHSLSIPVITDCVHYMDDAINETRSLSHRMLMPRFTESSLTDALQNLTAIYSHGRRTVTLKACADEERNIPAPVKEMLYRIAQEQLHNVEKYAKATDVNVYVNSDPQMITLCVEDNGLGFDPKKKRNGVGFTNIMNRAESFNGSARIISAPGEGCLLMVEIPFSKQVS